MNLLENQRAADVPAGCFQDLEELLMANIVKHCRDYKQPIASDVWQMRKLAEIGALNRENIRIIAKATGQSWSAMERMLNDAAEEAVAELEPPMRSLVRKGLAGEAVSVKRSKTVLQVAGNLKKQAKDVLNLCNTTMLYMARDAYAALVNNIAAESREIARKQKFLDILGRSATAVVIGAESRQQALRKCIQEFNRKGIPAFVDRRGREWTPEAYLNMAMRNTAKNVAEEVQTARCLDYGILLIEINSHSGARPKCAKDQGKIYSLDNESGYVEDVNGRRIPYYPWNSTSYGEPDGLLGINCTHHKYPFVPGISLQSYFPREDLKADAKLYKETQVQRALERDVRKQKRECMLYAQLGDDEAFQEAVVKLKVKEARLKQYVDGNGQLHRRRDREQVAGFDKSIGSKAAAANKAYTKARNTDKIPIKDTAIPKSVGAKARNYKVADKTTGIEYEFAPGTRIQDSEVFAGRGTRHPLHEGVAEGLTEEFGGTPSKWQHAKGKGVLVDLETGEEISAEVHWFQEETVGKVKFKLKRILDDEG